MRNKYYPFQSQAVRRTLLLAGLSCIASYSFAEKPSIAVYGQLHVSVDYLDTDGKDALGKDKSGKVNVSSNASNLGVRGKYAFDENFTAIYQLESSVNVVDADWELNRNSFLGLEGNWGRVRVGTMDTPLKLLRTRTEFFPNQVGDARNIVHMAHGKADRRFKNSINYQSPTLAGFTANIHYSANTNKGGTRDADTKALSSSLEYKYKDFWVAVAHDNTGKQTDSQQITRLASYYDFGVIRIAALYQHVKDDNYSSDAYGGGARWMVAKKWGLKGQAYRYRDTDHKTKADMLSLGVDYFYHKNLSFYLSSSYIKNSGTQVTPFAAARSAKPAIVTPGSPPALTHLAAEPFGVSLGAIFKF